MRAIRFILVGVGVAAIGYGVFGALTGPRTKPLGHLAFLAGVVVGHELILMPLAIGAGALVVRFVPQRVRGIVQGALLISAAVTLMALPMVLGLGGDPTNPSALPLNYGRGLLVVLAGVWTVALVLMAARTARADRPKWTGTGSAARQAEPPP